MQKLLKNPVSWIIISVLVLILGMQMFNAFTGPRTVPTSETIELLRSDTKLKEVVLIDQASVSDDKLTVGQLLKRNGVTVKRFVRFAAGA